MESWGAWPELRIDKCSTLRTITLRTMCVKSKTASPKTKGGHCWPPSFSNCYSEAVLDALDVLSLPALGAFDHVKLYLLTFLQAAETAGLNGGEMHEDILAVLAADESIAFGVIKPLHCSCFHDV